MSNMELNDGAASPVASPDEGVTGPVLVAEAILEFADARALVEKALDAYLAAQAAGVDPTVYKAEGVVDLQEFGVHGAACVAVEAIAMLAERRARS